MCGRYTLFVEQHDIEDRFDARFVESFEPIYNAAPGQQLPVITNEDPETIRRFEWGLVPSWSDEATGGLINARAETVHEKPSFRDAFERRRCLVPANGFYEWTDSNGGKQPYRIRFEDDRLFAMAGLWERNERAMRSETTQTGLEAFGGGTTEAGLNGDEEESEYHGDQSSVLETFTILTTTPNDVVESLHDRMPVLLDGEAASDWLNEADPRSVLRPHDPSGMEAYPVSTAVNNPVNDDPSVVEPVSI